VCCDEVHKFLTSFSQVSHKFLTSFFVCLIFDEEL